MLEVIAVIMASCSVILTAKKKILGWPLSLCATLCYFWIFFQQKLYADMILQIIFCVGILYGWYLWEKEEEEVKEERSAPHLAALLGNIMCILIFNFFAYYALRFWSADSAPFWDSTLSCASILASYWAAQRYYASWILWIIIDCLYTWLFYERHLYLTMFLYFGFVVIAFYGYHQWKYVPNKGGLSG